LQSGARELYDVGAARRVREGRQWTLTVEVRKAPEVGSVVDKNSGQFPDELPLAVGLLFEVNQRPYVSCRLLDWIRGVANSDREQVTSAETDIQCTRPVGLRERDTLLLMQSDRLGG
jgi:hypothetical protein